MYGIRVRKSVSEKWRRVRTLTHPLGRWSNRGPALEVLAKLRKRGHMGHVFTIIDPKVYPNATHYSEHFTRSELACKGSECVGQKPPARIEAELVKLAQGLELMRGVLGGRLGVTSGYRCPVHNKRVGGASLSQHMQGTAADLLVPPGEQDRYVAAAESVPAFCAGGIGVYPGGGVHVDRRGYKARWNSWTRS